MFREHIQLNGDNTATPRPWIGEQLTCRADFLISSGYLALNGLRSEPQQAIPALLSGALGYAISNAASRYIEHRQLKAAFGENYKDLVVAKHPPRNGEQQKYSVEIRELADKKLTSPTKILIGGGAVMAAIFAVSPAAQNYGDVMYSFGMTATVGAWLRERGAHFRFRNLSINLWSIQDHPPPEQETNFSKAQTWLEKNTRPAPVLAPIPTKL